MTSEPIRDPLIDHLLTPQNSALVVIDYQPFQLEVVTSMDSKQELSRSVGWAWRASCSGTGFGARRRAR